MEFGITIQGHVPGPAAHDPEREHAAFLDEIELVRGADRSGWKYAWTAEHHTLTEYSHLAASDVWMGYLAAVTDRIHLGAGIFNLSPRVNHPVRNAERAALLDHLTEGRFEFGTGRGAGSHELAAFMVKDPNSTRAEWDEVVREIPRMWERKDYTFFGDHFTVDTPHNVLPKPYLSGHPAIWLACGNPATFGKAGRLGLGALGFTSAPISEMTPLIDAYKEGIASCEEPVGQFVNDNVLLAGAVVCMERREHAREILVRPGRNYIGTLVNLYHDTFPKPPGAPVWPDPAPSMPAEFIDPMIEAGWVVCGTPDEVCEQLEAHRRAGLDQLVCAVPGGAMSQDENLECLELMGRAVIPEFDPDPEHSTTRYRRAAVARYGPFATSPVGAEIEEGPDRPEVGKEPPVTSEDDSTVPDYGAMLRLDGRAFVVVGAGRGNGRQTAHALAGAGARVLCVDVDETRAVEVAGEVGGVPCVANASVRDDAERYVSRAVDEFGRLDGVADIVGMAAWAPVLEMSDEDWSWSFDMCLRHAVLATQAAGRVLADGGGGSLVFVASISGLTSAPRHSAYGAFKAGLLSLVRTAADELAPRGVRVNAVTPGGIATPRLLGSTPEADRPPIGVLGGLARTSDIAAAILFLSSDLARMVTGQSLVVDGGAMVRYPYSTGRPMRTSTMGERPI